VAFYVLSKVLAPLTQPLSLALLLLLLFVVLRPRRPVAAWIVFGIALTGLYAASTDPVADWLAAPLERPYANRVVPARLDAIVVFGGCLDPRTDEHEIRLDSSADRLVKAVILAREHPDALLVFSGARGVMGRALSEGELLRRLALQLGIADNRIRVEPNAVNTRDNAVQCQDILEQEQRSTFVVVTSAMHMRRSLACFKGTGLEPIPYAVDFRSHPGMWTGYSLMPQISALSVSNKALHEYLGLAVYRIRGMA
jgi:uncharacterized SAM-binding protein YcdF (DUF218 family)